MTPEQILAANKANLETLLGLTNTAVAGVEKLIELNLAATKAAIAESQSHTHAALSVKDSQELLALQASVFQPLAEKMVNYNRHLYDIATGTSSEIGEVVEGKMSEAQHSFHSLVDNLSKNAPAGSEAAVTALKTAITTGTQALEQVQKAVKQASEMAESNFKSMTSSVLNATQTASAPAAKTTRRRA
jgi:phasin family protein